ncbi:hypothetical protein T08_2395 [Trichinella sp. T8]|nr:hypothetical protein T08_2395 [Trichinella sp. T8]
MIGDEFLSMKKSQIEKKVLSHFHLQINETREYYFLLCALCQKRQHFMREITSESNIPIQFRCFPI